MLKLTITILFACLFSACGLTETPAATFRIEMLASAEVPETATGDKDPRWETFTLTGVSMASADGSENYELYDGTDAKEAKIVNRPQLIYQKNIDSMAGMEMSAVSVSFDTALAAGSDGHDDLAATLSTGAFTLTEDFTIEEGQTRTLQVLVKWGKTVSDTTLQEPAIALDFP